MIVQASSITSLAHKLSQGTARLRSKLSIMLSRMVTLTERILTLDKQQLDPEGLS